MLIHPRARLLALILAIFAALLIAPLTRPIVAGQIAGLFLRPDPVAAAGDADALYARVAKAHPRDTARQIAYAYDLDQNDARNATNTGTRRLRHLRALEESFPAAPEVYAAALRRAQIQPSGTRSSDINRFDESYSRVDGYVPPPEELAAYDHDASTGERLDPENAFFPMLRAYGLFDGYRDAEALAEVHRAGSVTQWNEYLAQEVSGREALHRDVYGSLSAPWRVVIAGGILLPHYAALRSTARLAVYKAMKLETAGKVREGYEIRCDLIRVGSRMRAQSHLVIGSAVGASLVEIAMQRPGGMPESAHADYDSDESQAKWLSQFVDYFRGHGVRVNDAALRDEVAADGVVRKVFKAVSFVDSVPELKPGIELRTLAGILLVNIAWLLILGVAALLSARLSFAAEQRPLTRTMAMGILGGVIGLGIMLTVSSASSDNNAGDINLAVTGFLVYLVPLCGYIAAAVKSGSWRKSPTTSAVAGVNFTVAVIYLYLAISTDAPNYYCVIEFVCAALQAVIFEMTLRNNGSSKIAIVPSVLVMIAVAGLLFGTGAIVVAQMHSQLGLGMYLDHMFGIAPQISRIGDYSAVSVACGIALPIAVVLLLTAVSLVRRRPVAASVVRGLAAVAAPLVLGLTLLYTGMVVAAAHSDARLNRELNERVAHEGPYMASLAHLPWPGPSGGL